MEVEKPTKQALNQNEGILGSLGVVGALGVVVALGDPEEEEAL